MVLIRSRVLLVAVAIALVLAGVIVYRSFASVTLQPGEVFAVPGAGAPSAGTAKPMYQVQWRSGQELVLVASFVASHDMRVESVGVQGLDNGSASRVVAQYGVLGGGSLPQFDVHGTLPPAALPRPLVGAFTVLAGSQVVVRLVYRPGPGPRGRRDVQALRVQTTRLGREQTHLVPFPALVRLTPLET